MKGNSGKRKAGRGKYELKLGVAIVEGKSQSKTEIFEDDLVNCCYPQMKQQNKQNTNSNLSKTSAKTVKPTEDMLECTDMQKLTKIIISHCHFLNCKPLKVPVFTFLQI